jgi:hypothetical protein
VACAMFESLPPPPFQIKQYTHSHLQALDFKVTDHSPAPHLILIYRGLFVTRLTSRKCFTLFLQGVIFSKITHLITLWGAFYHSPAIFISEGLICRLKGHLIRPINDQILGQNLYFVSLLCYFAKIFSFVLLKLIIHQSETER